MGRQTRKGGANTLGLVILLLGALVVGYYATIALTSRDALWFLRQFDDRPARIVVYNAGEITELRPGAPGFEELAGAVETSLAAGFARLSSIGFSEQTLQQAYTEHITLEVFWAQPIELHAWFPTGRTTQMLFPITGSFSELSIVLLGDGGRYRAGAPVLETMGPVRDALGSLGYD